MWHRVQNASVGVLAALDQVLCTLQQQKPTLFPDFSDDTALLAASDYSGQHKDASYEGYSFVFTTPKRWKSWERHRLEVRSSFLLTRRISFKTLDDNKRWEVLPFFLAAAARLEAVTITILVNKSLQSLFASSGTLDLKRPELARVSMWKIPVLEKLLRVTHLMGLFTAGLSREGQDLFWISDEDDIIANADRLREVTGIFAGVSSNLLGHNLRHLRLGTTASDDRTMQLEDLAAIADLAAGAFVEVLTDLESSGRVTSPHLIQPAGPKISQKTRALMAWLTTRGMPHQHVVVALDAGEGEGKVHLKRLVFDTVKPPSRLK